MAQEPSRSTSTFISHTSEDNDFSRYLANELTRRGVDAWFDEYEIRPGDSIREAIGKGLLGSEYGVVILTPRFFEKDWPKKELAALDNVLERGRLIPVFHQMTVKMAGEFDPLLLDIRGVDSRNDVAHTAAEISLKVLGTESVDDDGRAVYRGRTLRVQDIPWTDDGYIDNMVFEYCTLVGPVVLSALPRDEVEWEAVTFAAPDQFIPNPRAEKPFGSVGIRRCRFFRVNFVDVGFFMSPADVAHALQSIPIQG